VSAGARPSHPQGRGVPLCRSRRAGPLWPVAAPEQIVASARAKNAVRDSSRLAIVPVAHQLAITLEAAARFRFPCAQRRRRLWPVSLDVTLGDGAHFTWRGASWRRRADAGNRHDRHPCRTPDAVSNQVVRSVLGGPCDRLTISARSAVARGADGKDGRLAVGPRHAARPHGDGQCQARTRNLCRRREVRARLRGGRTRQGRVVLPRLSAACRPPRPSS
jgi:hypothetical protein